jgi:glutamyl-tRNA reductase
MKKYYFTTTYYSRDSEILHQPFTITNDFKLISLYSIDDIKVENIENWVSRNEQIENNLLIIPQNIPVVFYTLDTNINDKTKKEIYSFEQIIDKKTINKVIKNIILEKENNDISIDTLIFESNLKTLTKQEVEKKINSNIIIPKESESKEIFNSTDEIPF